MQPPDELYSTADDPIVRKPFPWSMRKLDLDIWTKPRDAPIIPMSASDRTIRCCDASKSNATPADAEAKLASAEGDHVHRVAIETELTERGPMASNQLDKLRGLLKDSPRQYILRRHPVNVPALSVVHYPSVDPSTPVNCYESYTEYHGGYGTGPKKFRSLSVKGNQIPMADYERQKYICLRGQDFK